MSLTLREGTSNDSSDSYNTLVGGCSTTACPTQRWRCMWVLVHVLASRASAEPKHNLALLRAFSRRQRHPENPDVVA